MYFWVHEHRNADNCSLQPGITKNATVVLSNIEYDLANMPSLLHAFMRAPGIFQRKDHVHHRRNATLCKKRPHLRLQFPRDASLEVNRSRTQRRAGMGQTLGHQYCEIGCSLRTVEKSDLHDAAIFRCSFVIAVDIITTDHIENHIGAFALGHFLDDLDKILLPVIDGVICSKFQAGFAFSFEPAVAMTVAPNAFASWIAVVPIPDEPP